MDLPDEVPGGVAVEQVVVGELFALELFGAGDAALLPARDLVEGRPLVRVLAVAQDGRPPQREVDPRRQLRGRLGRLAPCQIARDLRVIGRRVREGLPRQPVAQLVGEGPIVGIEHRRDLLVGRRIDHHRDIGVVLRGRADHRRSANVDVLDRLFERHARFADRLQKGIEVDDHQVDRQDSVLVHSSPVLGVRSNPEQSAVHARVQRLDPPIEHLRKSRQLGDVAHGQSVLPEEARRPPCRDQLDAVRRQPPGEVDQSRLVRDAQQRPLHSLPRGFHTHLLPTVSAPVDRQPARVP